MDEIEKITEKVLNNKHASMSISRIPKKTKERFVKLAEEEFCNDYGMTLKYLLDYFYRSSTFEYLVEEIEALKNALTLANQEEPQKRKIKLVSGKEIEV